MTQENQKNSFLQRLQARKAGVAAPAASAINPPEAEVAPSRSVSTLFSAAIPAAPPTIPQAAPEPEPEPMPVADIEQQIAEVTAAVAEPFKRGRGRPRKDESAPMAAPVATVAAVAPVTKANIVGGWTLYINCAPVKGPEIAAAGEYRWAPRLENIAPRIERVMREFTAETGLAHYRLAEYGKGPALFAEGFARDLAENPPKGDVMVDIASQEVRDVLQMLIAAAHIVVRGFGN